MPLSSELISQFAKITNDENIKKSEEATLYGTALITEDGGVFVKFDGAEEMTPVTTILEKDDTGEMINYKYGAASVNSGDRVSVSLKNHSATITGNLSDPPTGRAEFKVNTDSILARVGKTEMWIKDEGVTFLDLSNPTGKTVINGSCIQTGTINLTDCIKFTDLNAEMQNTITTLESDVDTAQATADAAVDDANYAYGVARNIANGTYLKGTFIDGKTIKSPKIEGNEIRVYGTFQTIGLLDLDGDGYPDVTGYMGAAQGMDEDGNDTYGVALARTWNAGDYTVSNSYVIVTNAGVRLQYGENRVIVTTDGIYLNTGSGAKAYYNSTELGNGTAVWG